MGFIGEKLYEAVFERRFSLSEALDYLKTDYGIMENPEKLAEMAEALRGRGNMENSTDEFRTGWGNSVYRKPHQDFGGLTIHDPAGNPEKDLMEKRKTDLKAKTLSEVLSQLTGEEKLMLRMRFPVDPDGTAKDIKNIAQILGLTEKAADHRIRRILLKCREYLLQKGLTKEDLIED